ncbi:hypothetical protein RUND412_010073 [Rhizina undulata]
MSERGGPPPIPWYTHPKNFLKKRFNIDQPVPGSSSAPYPVHAPHPKYGPPPSHPRLLINGAYYPNWRIYKNQPPSSLALNMMSHLFYAFAWVKDDGSVYLSDPWADSQIPLEDGTTGCLRSFQKLKNKHTHLKVILSIGGGGKGSDNFASTARDHEKRERFARTAREFVVEYGLDGIDIDWEHPSDPQQGRDYISLLATIRRHLPPPYQLTSALPAGEWALCNIDLHKASHHLDYINLMSYDFSGPWTPQSGHHAQLFSPRNPHCDTAAISAHSATSYLRSRGVPPHKILLGIPTYGRSFLCNGLGQTYAGTAGEEGTFEYRDLPREGATEYVDEAVGAAWCVGGDGGWVTYDNVQTVRMKARYAKDSGLAGLFYWTATGDRDGEGSLVRAGFGTLHEA